MKTVHCAAVDLGATSGRVIVGSWDGRRLGLKEVHRFPNQFRSLGAREYWDIPLLWSEVRTGLCKAKRLFPRLASVGVDSWAVDHVLVDGTGRPVFPVHAYRDTRTAELSEQLGRSGMERIYSLTGVPNYPYNTSLQLQETLQACPGIAKVAKRCLFIPDYFNFLLSGRMENELSIASHSQLLDVRGNGWSSAAMDYFGIPRSWFDKPALSPARLGTVTGIPELKGVGSILVNGHDTASAFAAMPAAPNGLDLYLSSGTWSLLGIENEKPLLGPVALRERISNERMGDGRYRPLKSCLGLWLLERVLLDFRTRPRNPADWRKLITAASREPAPGRLLDLGDATLFNPRSMRASIDTQLESQRTRVPSDIAGYARLICSSVAQGHASAAAALGRLSGKPFKRILMVGGGSQNRLLCQETANASGLPVASYLLEGAAVGNLAAQLIALGEVRDIAAFRGKYSRQLRVAQYHPR
jgi:rhamnulokinase